MVRQPQVNEVWRNMRTGEKVRVMDVDGGFISYRNALPMSQKGLMSGGSSVSLFLSDYQNYEDYLATTSSGSGDSRCQCGAKSVKATKHSVWCPAYA